MRTNSIFTVAQAAQYLGLKPRQILYGIQRGTIKAQKLGWIWTISEKEVHRLKQSGES